MENPQENNKTNRKDYVLSFRTSKEFFFKARLLSINLFPEKKKGSLTELLNKALEEYLERNLGEASSKIFASLREEDEKATEKEKK